ncbi:MAG: citrate synthase/methylcitrate synthase [Candidatus Thermoplasmatota archaeon]|jgi:citrate synthase|nr:citrate synthase/methylcitrate synthase [Candidatus Thermoplasmatota archaeon]MCL5786327.1 citrate synthase/methylcitrate synthase [Candidatus Thermoplasmatota archaeon]
MPDDQEIHRGLEGVIVSESKVGSVDGLKGRLIYRGYDIETLVKNSTYEEVSFLLVNGELPNKGQFSEFLKVMNDGIKLPEKLVSFIDRYAGYSHPMADLRSAVSVLGSEEHESSDLTPDQQKDIGLSIIAKMPAIVAAIKRKWEGKNIVPPKSGLSYAQNFLYMTNGSEPSRDEAKVMDTCLIIHADHGSNASTFSSLVTISTLSDMCSAVTSGISTLKGPLHGGANEMALKMIKKIGTPDNADKAIGDMLARKDKVMGFGHRVYKVYDPRAKILKEFARSITSKSGKQNLFDTAEAIEKAMISRMGDRGIFPNVDFYSGMVYESIGFPENMFTPIFAASRSSGWVARSFEYVKDNRLFRPRTKYTGEVGPREYIPMDRR